MCLEKGFALSEWQGKLYAMHSTCLQIWQSRTECPTTGLLLQDVSTTDHNFTYVSLFNYAIQHENGLAILLPDHQPKVSCSVRQWTLHLKQKQLFTLIILPAKPFINSIESSVFWVMYQKYLGFFKNLKCVRSSRSIWTVILCILIRYKKSM